MIAPEAATYPTVSVSPTRRSFLRAIAVAGAFGRFLAGTFTLTETGSAANAEASFNSLNSTKPAASGGEAIRPFHVSVPEEQLANLRRARGGELVEGDPHELTNHPCRVVHLAPRAAAPEAVPTMRPALSAMIVIFIIVVLF